MNMLADVPDMIKRYEDQAQLGRFPDALDLVMSNIKAIDRIPSCLVPTFTGERSLLYPRQVSNSSPANVPLRWLANGITISQRKKVQGCVCKVVYAADRASFANFKPNLMRTLTLTTKGPD